MQDEAQVVRLVDQLFHDAISKGASDLHVEPFAKYCKIRLRIDGLLHTLAEYPHHLTNQINARIKILASLDIAERRLPQDGRFNFEQRDRLGKDCRISTCPTIHGEKTVVRLLDTTFSKLAFNELGLQAEQCTQLTHALAQTQGMILVTGPTGSGKTVTLYTALQQLNDQQKNIMTIEDPVEIALAGVNQVHVNPQIGLSFATALRAFLRQDPDIIMVGEIRDLETAETAIRAAHTGHLVLATLHTQNTCATLLRLLHMGIAPLHITSTVHLTLAQRLIRRLCEHCKQPVMDIETHLDSYPFAKDLYSTKQIYQATGCGHCHQGYQGRIGIYECLPMSPALADLMMQQPSYHELVHFAKQRQFHDLMQAALNGVKAGITSLAEITRVLGSGD